LLVRLLGLGESWLLALDLTNWRVGKTDVNYLVHADVTPRFRVPLIWSLIGGCGCSDTGMRIALIERYLAHFPATIIRLLLADREFVGADWMEFLCKNNISFAIRVKENMRITTEDGAPQLVRVALRRADEITGFGEARLWSETTRPTPRPGDRIEIDGEAFLIQGEPVRDRERLVWTVDLRPT